MDVQYAASQFASFVYKVGEGGGGVGNRRLEDGTRTAVGETIL